MNTETCVDTVLDPQPSADHPYYNNHPFGRHRCIRKCWLEYNQRKGFRFCYQTTKKGLDSIRPGCEKLLEDRRLPSYEDLQAIPDYMYNKPKKSTYVNILAVCYICGDNGHIDWRGVHYVEDVDKFDSWLPNGSEDKLSDCQYTALDRARHMRQKQIEMQERGVI